MVTSRNDGSPVEGAKISSESLANGSSRQAITDTKGRYAFTSLSPGVYRLRVEADGYQAAELYELSLPISGFLEQNFALRLRSDLFEQGRTRNLVLGDARTLVTFYGPDLDLSRTMVAQPDRHLRGELTPSLSRVIDPLEIRHMPFAGRDIYTSLLLHPGVTADLGTRRGIGVSATGQRASSASYLIDGFENNNNLVTGPLLVLPPEFIQEYRISTGNYSAEFGGSSGFLTNAVTRSGSESWHGSVYGLGKHHWLNATEFQRNASGAGKSPYSEQQGGIQLGGRIVPRLYTTTTLDGLRTRGHADETDVSLPSASFIQSLESLPASHPLRSLLTTSMPAVEARSGASVGTVQLRPTVSLNRWSFLQRVDSVPEHGAHRVLARFAAGRLTRPDYIWSPYPDFQTELNNRNTTAGIVVTSTKGARLTNEARVGVFEGLLRFDRPHPNLPILSLNSVVLPASSAFYDYRNHERGLELSNNTTWFHGRHAWKFGASALLRLMNGYLTAGGTPKWEYSSLEAVRNDTPFRVQLSLDRSALGTGQSVKPTFDRDYRQDRFAFFGQDAFRWTSRLSMTIGVRWEYFAPARNSGDQDDLLLRFGEGSNIVESLQTARFISSSETSGSLYGSDRNDWSARAGLSYALSESGDVLLRFGYGSFYDRLFDNLWHNIRNNSFELVGLRPAVPIRFDTPIENLIQQTPASRTTFSRVTAFQPGFRTPYVHSAFVGFQSRLGRWAVLELSGIGATGRKLVTTDLLNRINTVAFSPDNLQRRYAPGLPDISYRSNQGTSLYSAATAAVSYRAEQSSAYVAYTFGHSIDNQSEPLAGEFDDLSPSAVSSGGQRPGLSRFTLEGDSSIDRASSDFDQRHNLIFVSTWQLPSPAPTSRLYRWLNGWRVSEIAAVRSGMPFTVFANAAPQIANGRADLLLPGSSYVDTPVPGGRRLLNPNAFGIPEDGVVGTSGRNAFRGPGFYNLDLSIARTIPLVRFSDQARFVIRADFFNALNHANLGAPSTYLGAPNFGVALYGREERNYGVPLLTPLRETARQVQLMLRVEF